MGRAERTSEESRPRGSHHNNKNLSLGGDAIKADEEMTVSSRGERIMAEMRINIQDDNYLR